MGGCGSKEAAISKTIHSDLIQTLDDHEGGINCAALSDDGSILATGSEDKTARIWSTKTEYCECIGILIGHEDYLTAVLVEDHFVLSASSDKTIKKWDMSTCECMHTFKGHTSIINRIICNGDFIFSSSYDRTIRCWDFDTGECIRIFSGHKKGIYPLIFIPADEEEITVESFEWDGNKDILISGSADFTAKSWSFETGKCLQTFAGHEGVITSMCTDTSGKTLLTGATDCKIISWNILKGEQLKVMDGHNSSILTMVVANKMVYTGSSDMTGRAWVIEFGDCTRIFKGHKHSVSCMKHHDGILYTGCGDGTSRGFDAKTGLIKKSFLGHSGTVNVVQVVDNRLFSGSHDGSLKVWDISNIKDDGTVNGKGSNGRLSGTPTNPSRLGTATPAKIIIEDDDDIEETL